MIGIIVTNSEAILKILDISLHKAVLLQIMMTLYASKPHK